LVVEDETIARTAMHALLCDSGFETWAVASGEEALRVAQREQKSFVALIDLDLPGMNGAELLTELRRVRPDSRAVIITAASGDRVRELLGVDDETPHLRKPLDFRQLLTILSENEGAAPTAD